MKPGYKQTEVGVIPEEWEISDLQQICRAPITYGIVQCGPHLRDGVPYIRVSDMDGPELEVDSMLRTSKSIASKFARSTVEEGDLVYALRGKLGEVRQVPAELAGANLTQGTARLSPNDRVASDYFIWALRDPRALKHAELEAKGTTFREITLADLRRVSVLVPPLPEQRAIAAALSEVDALLAALDRLIAKKLDLKQAAMQQLLTGQTRLPGFEGEWVVKRLGDVASVSKGTQLHSSETDEGGSFAHLNGGITPSGFTYRSNTAGNTIAISEGGNSCGFVQLMTDPYWCGGHCYSVIPSRVDNHFIYHALKGQQSNIMGLRVGSGLPNVQKTSLLDFKIKIPTTLPEQTAIAAVLSDMDAELAALEQRREKTRALKQGMMQELLTGRTRLV
jgi:type I restriction enzyme S subunit